ncbi:MAG: aminopeptidase P family protein [Bacteroidota bacterium]
MHHLHRNKLYSLFEDEKGLVYLKGADIMYRYDTDYEFPFRQESNFWYLTGVNEPDCHAVLDLATQTFHLFVPKRDAQYAVWHGFVKTLEDYHEQYKPDEIHFENDLIKVINTIDPETIYCLNEEQAEFVEDLDRSYQLDIESLEDAITYCRSIKTSWELDQLREASRINSLAHQRVLKTLEPGKFEYEMKAEFDGKNIMHGLMQDAYNGIFATGKNSAVLHYVENDSMIEDGDLFLIDAGFEYNGYSSDFTRTYPANGTFTEIQAGIYQAVLDAQKEAIAATKPGVKMEDLHMQAARTIMSGLKNLGLVNGSLDDLMENNIFALFFPHGLGHFLGLDTHDVGGYPKGVDRIDRPGLKYLRARRTLEAGMVLTIEPGVYFIPALLEPAFDNEVQAEFLNESALRDLFDFGGVRIEDNLIVTENSHENMTNVPKEIEEIEAIMAESRSEA